MNDKHHGPHCAGSCEGAAYQIEIERLRAENKALRKQLAVARRDYEVMNKIREGLEQAQTVPSGWQLVPVEPTEQMIEATEDVIDCPVSMYYAMLAAAPKPGGGA
ncbi:hypothetical protein [Thioalkalivibrio sp. ALE12]|uniref:hypothetical protein n=1 Tax=Thioalkalivibrio sp. ALE12 TaxID=1158170 RepID=UPI0003803AB1|nr:hypothetical protein [Thioalkalivibrio sp. ALE12]